MTCPRRNSAVRCLAMSTERLFAALALLLTALLAAPACAACKIPLPTISLRALDDRTDADPAAVDAEVSRRLAALADTDSLQAAELYVVQAEAASLMNNPSKVHAAAAASRARLRRLSDAAIRDALEFRLVLIEADSSVSDTEFTTALADLTRLEPTMPADSLQHACLLIMRSGVNRRLGKNDDSVSDGLLAHQITTAANAPSATADAAFELAYTYWRAGLLLDAINMADEVIDYSRSAKLPGELARGLQVKAWILTRMQRYAEALAAIAEARQLDIGLSNTADAAYADLGRCDVLLKMDRLDEAEGSCVEAEHEWTAAGRLDQLPRAEVVRADIALARGDPRAALARLNPILSADLGKVPASLLPDLYHSRSRAFSELGRYREALADLNAEERLNESGDRDRRNIAAAILKGNFEAEAAANNIRLLRAAADSERLLADRQTLIRNITVIVAALLSAAILLLWWNWRRRKESERLREVLQERSAFVGRLTAGIAHEFNNQLTVMQQGLGMLANRPSIAGDPVAELLIGEMQRANRASSEITAQLQSFGRQQSLNPQNISLQELFARIAPTIAMVAGDKVRVEVDSGSPPAVVWADERQLSAALINLIANARDAMPAGGTVKIRADMPQASRTTIAVNDQGTGMTPEVLSKATEPFFTTKSLGSGSGLGLSMVDGFVTQSCGSMRVESVIGHGTTVTLELPAGSKAS